MKRLGIYYIFWIITIGCFAQDLEIKTFELMAKDQTVTLSPRKDINGNDCALVMVRTLKKNMVFEGWVVGNVDYKDDCYWVYMANGAKHLNIKHPDYQSKKILFSEYGIGSIKGGQFYNLCIVDVTKDVINKVYSLGWNINDIDVPDKAVTFLNMSAQRGDKKAITALAQLSVGEDVKKGEFLEQNKGLYWINKLLEKGDSLCLDSMPGKLMYVYACKLIRDGKSYDRSDTYKERTIYTKASRFELKACLKGYKEAGNDFFMDYIQGYGLPDYKEEVLRLCNDSASVGNANAMTCLGHIYEKGICEATNLQTASKWYKKALETDGSKQNMTNLCRVYGNCHYPIDGETLTYIEQKAEEGLQEALFQLGCMYEEGRNVEKNIEKALGLYSQIEHPGAKYHLAQFAFDQKDYKKADDLLNRLIYYSHNYYNIYLYEDDVLFLYAMTQYNLYTSNDARVRVFNILSDLSKKGYQKATDFIKKNY